MQNKKGFKFFGLLIFGVLIFSLLVGVASAAYSVNQVVTDAMAQQMGYVDANEYAQANGGSTGLTQVYADTLNAGTGSSTSAGSSATSSVAGFGNKVDTTVSTIGGYIGAVLKPFGLDKFDYSVKVWIAKVLLIILLLMIVYGVSEFLPFVNKEQKTLRWFLALIIAALAFLFIPNEMITDISGTYQSLGVMIVTVIPLIILIAFTIEMRKKSPEYAFVNKILIIGFIVFLAVAWVSDLGSFNKPNLQTGSSLRIVYPITLLAAVIWYFLERRVYSQIARALVAGDLTKADRRLLRHLQDKRDKLDDTLLSITDPGRKAALQAEIDTLDKQIKAAAKRAA